jgi:diaminopimelate epimerase
MLLEVEKIHGCKNDYLFFDFVTSQRKHYAPDYGGERWAEIARKYCDRTNSLGADGIILMLPAEKLDCEMRIFNADGSEAEMCGNGLRGVVRMLDAAGEKGRVYRILTKAGVREGQVKERFDDGSVQVICDMGRPSFLPARIPVLFDDVMVLDEDFEVGSHELKVSCVSMGNPHCVIEVSKLDEFPVQEVGPLIEAFPQGTNVEFIEIRDGQIFQRTWERGSGETLACGTGACAVGVVLIMKKQFKKEVKIHLRGGELQVQWDGLREVFLTGESVSQGFFPVEI